MLKIPRLLQAVLIVVGIYCGFVLVFDILLQQVIPSSLLNMYMFFVIAGVLAVYTFTEDGARELLEPIKSLVEDPSKKTTRNVVFAITPIIVSGFVLFNDSA